MFETNVKAVLRISGLIECRDAAGEVVKTIPMEIEVPLPEEKPAEEGPDVV